MNKNRMEAFSDAVLAIIITIMVLEMKVPHGTDFAALRPLLPVFLTYVLSFIYLAIYWNNHHHMLHVTQHVSGAILWANLHLLFWLSLFPFVTGWMGENHFAAMPTALYGVVLLMAASVLDFAAGHHRPARPGIRARESRGQRLQGEDIPRALCHRDIYRVFRAMGGRGAVCAGSCVMAGA
jgi:uncharacterized membrane protein